MSKIFIKDIRSISIIIPRQLTAFPWRCHRYRKQRLSLRHLKYLKSHKNKVTVMNKIKWCVSVVHMITRYGYLRFSRSDSERFGAPTITSGTSESLRYASWSSSIIFNGRCNIVRSDNTNIYLRNFSCFAVSCHRAISSLHRLEHSGLPEPYESTRNALIPLATRPLKPYATFLILLCGGLLLKRI